MNPLTAILCIGDELLKGSTLNSNLADISFNMMEAGFPVSHHYVCSDDLEDINLFLEQCFKNHDRIIVSGGLGPTSDDKTRFAAEKYFNEKLELNREALASIKKRFQIMNREMTESNIIQAYLPKNSVIMENNNGTACGFLCKKKGKKAYFIPGVPREALGILKESIIPDFMEDYGNSALQIDFTFYTSGIAESTLYDRILTIKGWGKTEKYFSVGFYPGYDGVALRFTKSLNINEKKTDSEDILAFFRTLFPVIDPFIYLYSLNGNLSDLIEHKPENSYSRLFSSLLNLSGKIKTINLLNIYQKDIHNIKRDDLLPNTLYRLLNSLGLSLSVAESCTGGLLSSKLTNISGISSVYKGGIISYSNEIKEKFLGIPSDILMEHGAVSEETAQLMAKNCSELFNTDISISATGIAGPTGSTTDKPVGLVYLGLYLNWTKIKRNLNSKPGNTYFPVAEKHIFYNSRPVNKERFANTALFLAIKNLYSLFEK